MLKPLIHEVKADISGVKKQFPKMMLYVFLWVRTEA